MRKIMAMVLAIQKWRHDLLGRRFVVWTDQRSLKYLLEQRVVPGEFQQWVTKLMGYDFEIQYRPGMKNKATGALSRVCPPVEFSAITVPTVVDVQTLMEPVATDPLLSKIKDLQGDTDSHTSFSLEQGRLLYNGRLVISQASSLIQNLLKEYHNSLVGGYFGFLRTYKRLTDLYWRGMKKDIKKFVEECALCK